MDESKAERTAAITRSTANGKQRPLASCDSCKYIQHDLRSGNGLSSILEFMNALPRARTWANVLRAFEVGDYSAVPVDYEPGDWVR